MTQLSLFSADLAEPRIEDLGGLLAAHGQAARSGATVKLSILCDQSWRATALLRECQVRDVVAQASTPDPRGAPVAADATLLSTTRDSQLLDVAAQWSRGAVKAVPGGLVLTAGTLRCWTLAAGRSSETGFLLGLDPHAPDMYEPLAAACSRAGIAGSVIGAGSAQPAIRVVGRRRLLRLTELLGTPPPGTPAGAFPAL